MSRKNFTDLIVWQRAVEFVPVVYELLRQFPPEERFALGDQIRHAAVSVDGQHRGGSGTIAREGVSAIPVGCQG